MICGLFFPVFQVDVLFSLSQLILTPRHWAAIGSVVNAEFKEKDLAQTSVALHAEYMVCPLKLMIDDSCFNAFGLGFFKDCKAEYKIFSINVHY